MDNSKVNGVNLPPAGHATLAQPPRANLIAADRFSRAMAEPRAEVDNNDRRSVRGTPISSLTPEGSHENREYAYRRLQSSLGGDAMGAVARDVAADALNERTKARLDPAQMALYGSSWSQFAIATQARALAVPQLTPGAELTQMLERMCTALYVGDKSVSTQRVVMALDYVLPGAAAEIVREGVHLSIRLHARTEESYRSMSSQRDALVRALNAHGGRRVDVSVVQADEQGFGDDHG